MRNIIAALLLTASFSLVAEESDNRKFLNTDIFELEIAGDPQISPDGSQVAYVWRSMDIMTDRARANVWVVDTGDVANRRKRPPYTHAGIGAVLRGAEAPKDR